MPIGSTKAARLAEKLRARVVKLAEKTRGRAIYVDDVSPSGIEDGAYDFEIYEERRVSSPGESRYLWMAYVVVSPSLHVWIHEEIEDVDFDFLEAALSER